MSLHHRPHQHPGFQNTAFVQGVPRQTGAGTHHRRRKHTAQAGGNPIAALIAVGTALKAMKPFSHGKTLLENVVSEKGKKTLGYKIGHVIASVGSSLGLGHKKKKKRHTKRAHYVNFFFAPNIKTN